MLESSFILPPLDDIDIDNIHLDEYSTTILEDIRTILDYNSIYHIKPVYANIINKVSHYMIDKCISSFPFEFSPFRIARLVFSMNTEDSQRNDYIIRMSYTRQTLIECIVYFIQHNIDINGIFTEIWVQPSLQAFKVIGNNNDIFINIYGIDTINDSINDVMDREFERYRDEVIDKTYSEHSNHDIVIIDEYVERCKDNNECHICYEKSDYVCSKCNYPICDACVQHLKHSTGMCPCCRGYPLTLKKVDGDECTINNGDECTIDNGDEEDITTKTFDDNINCDDEDQCDEYVLLSDNELNSDDILRILEDNMNNYDKNNSDDNDIF